MITRTLRFVLVSALALSGCIAAAEIGRRILDGYRVWTLELTRDPNSTDLTLSDRRDAGTPSMAALLATIERDAEVDASWFDDRPQPVSGISPRWADQRRAAFNQEANYVWNAATLNDPAPQAFFQKNQARLDEILTFRAPDAGRHPAYRLYPEIDSGFGFTNQFGWRGPSISRDKPRTVIRIGVLGDSTTFGYPRLLEHWLNLWSSQRGIGVRFEVVNTARPSTGALDAAAVLDFELDAVDPDYVVLYGFGNGIYFADALVPLPPGVVRGKPPLNAGMLDALSTRITRLIEPEARWSAAANFLLGRLTGPLGRTHLLEPLKPSSRIAFPSDINEAFPDPASIAAHRGGGVMFLDVYLQALHQIDLIATRRGIRLFVSTFRVMAFEGMLLGRGAAGNGSVIYNNLNSGLWWPNTYAQIHRLNDFYNRTLRAWAQAAGHRIIPVNEQMPWQPELYRDALHELTTGEALHAWIVLQQLLPEIRDDLAHHRLPREGHAPRAGLNGYWKIERTRVATVLNVAALVPRRVDSETELPTEIPSAPPESVDDVPGAFILSKLAQANVKARIVTGVVPVVRTAPEPSTYAAFVPVEAVGLAGRGWLRVRVRVKEGKVSIGVLNKSGQAFLSTAGVEQSLDMQEVSLPIEDLSEVGNLMISNGRDGESAPSIAEVHGVVLQRVR